jgi:AraC-like DNA-binding protein
MKKPQRLAQQTPPRRDIAVRSQLVGSVLAFVARKGGDAAALAERFGLPASTTDAPDVLMPLGDLQRFFDAAEAAIADPSLGLHLVTEVPARRFTALEYGAKSAATVRAAFHHIARTIPLFNEHVIVSFEERRDEGLIRQSIPGRPLCIGRAGNEFFVARVFAGLREGVPGLRPRRVFFAHPRPRDVRELVRFFATEEIAFDAEANGLAFAIADLDRPLASRDDALAELVAAYVESELGRRRAEPGGGLVSQVRAIVRDQIEHGGPDIASLADRLRMSPRSLQRRMRDHGTSLQDVVQLVREELARTWVAESRRPLTAIAFDLGYAELTPFVRAFRRWTKQTPAAYRNEQVKAGRRT